MAGVSTGWPIDEFGSIVLEGSGSPITGVLPEAFTPLGDLDSGLKLNGVFPGGNIPSGKIIIVGDSITANNGGVSIATPTQSIDPSYNSRGYFTWANVMCNQYFTVVGNAGIAGQNTNQIVARFKTDVLAYKSDWVCILAGTNDISLTAEVTIKNLKWMYDASLSAGRRIIACTIPPNSVITLQQRQNYMKVNNWIVSYARTRSGIVVADIGSALSDPTKSWEPLAGTTSDGTHLSPTGAVLAGRMIYEAVKGFIPTSFPIAFASGDVSNLVSNPMMYGTGTAMPTAWWITGAATTTYVPRDNGMSGNMLQVTAAAAGSISITQLPLVDGVAMSIGDTIVGRLEFEASNLSTTEAAKAQGITFKIACWNGSAYTLSTSDAYWDNSYDNMQYPLTKGSFKTTELKIPAGTVSVQVGIVFKGAGTYKVSRVALSKV